MTELLVRESGLPTISDPQVWAQRRQQFNAWVNSQLNEGVDFGKVPGTDKATLLKPGAEKIIQAFGCSPEVTVTVRDQDPDTGYLYVEVAVRLVCIQTGAVVATGLGACSSYESKYRWRWEYFRGKGNPEGSDWETFYDRQKRTTGYRRRIENRDLIDVWNTVLKMAKKRALVDAALTVSGASEKFTQDIEDFEEPVSPRPVQQPAPAPAQARAEEEPMTGAHWIDDQRVRVKFWEYVQDKLALTSKDVYEALAVNRIHDYQGTMQDAKAALEAYVARKQAEQPAPAE